jgi:hypothetical protein
VTIPDATNMTLITLTIPSLALSIDAMIGIIIFLLIFGGQIYGVIAKAKQKSQQPTEAGDKPQPTLADRIKEAIETIKQSQDPNYKPGQPPTNSDMQQRLERMRREANTSREDSSASEDADDRPVLTQVNPSGPSSGSQPSNLTMEQKQLRQRAREEYERRAMELRRQRAAGQTQASGQSPAPAQQSQAPQSRPSSSGTSNAPSPSTTSSLPQSAPPRRPPPQQQQPLPPVRVASEDPVVQIGSTYEVPSSRDEPVSAPLPSSQQKPSRRPAPAPAAAAAKPVAVLRTGVVDAATLRQAILWREILDKPLALRDPNDRF